MKTVLRIIVADSPAAMFWYVAARCAAVHGAHSGIFRSRTYIRVMAFIRIKIIRKNGKTYRYRYLQHNVRIGKKVKSFMRFLGAIGSEILTGGGPDKLPADYFQAPKQDAGQKWQETFLNETQEKEPPTPDGS